MSLRLKQNLHSHVEGVIQERILQAKLALSDIIEARNSESKSSAGDKYETGRAMMQIAQQQQEQQLNAAYALLQQLKAIDLGKTEQKIKLGSLVKTNQGIFYLSISLGQVEYDNTAYYLLSVAAPLSQLLLGKTTSEAFTFRDKPYEILAIS